MNQQQLPPPEAPGEDSEPQSGATFWEHLGELRNRLFYCAAVFLLSVILAWTFRDALFLALTRPIMQGLAGHGIYRLTAIEATEAIVIYLKMAVAAAVVVTIPFTLVQLWLFIRPGLKTTEIRPLRRVVVLSLFMFLLGLLFSYRFVLPLVLDFLAGFTLASGDLAFQVTLRSAYSTALTFLAGFGVIFELPLVMVLLAATPIMNSRRYWKLFRYFVVVSFIVAAILTPPDVLSQFLMALPLNLLYLVGIAMAWFLERKRDSGVPSDGIDWMLPASIIPLTGLLVWLVMPSPKDPREYLPEQVLQLGSCSGFALDDCPIDSPRRAPAGADAFTRADFAEGSLRFTHFASAGEAETACRTTSPIELGAPPCLTQGSWSIQGPPMLLMELQERMNEAPAVPGPLSLYSDRPRLLLRMAGATDRSQPEQVLLVSGGEGDENSELLITFADSYLAGGLERLLAQDPTASFRSGLPVPREERLEAAMLLLLEAMEAINRKDPSLSSLTQPALEEARSLLSQPQDSRDIARDPGAAGPSTTGCLVHALLRQMGPPISVSREGRTLYLKLGAVDARQWANLWGGGCE